MFFHLALIPTVTLARPTIFDTEGFTSGQLGKVSQTNTFGGSFVGEILLGRESTAFISIGHQSPNLVTNPWRFCFEDDHNEQLENLIGSYVVLKYKTPKKSSLLSCSAAKVRVHYSDRISSVNLHERNIRSSVWKLEIID